nr:MAG TPA: AP2 domain protein [Caudoviricetes sp.]
MIYFNKKQHSLGYYKTIEDAEIAAISGRERLSHMTGD